MCLDLGVSDLVLLVSLVFSIISNVELNARVCLFVILSHLKIFGVCISVYPPTSIYS